MAEKATGRRIEIIPVLDLMGGRVVRGAGGDRARYRPIETPLSPSPAPLAVLSGLLTLGAFKTVYIADLDAIMVGRPQVAILVDLLEAFPDVTFWIDAGFREASDVARLRSMLSDALKVEEGRFVPVLGSETLADALTIEAAGRDGEVVLSLDFGPEGYRGPPSLLHDRAAWPQIVVVMTLAAVGGGKGPDLSRIAAIAKEGGGRRIIAAGGVRNEDDLQALETAGAAGVLVASALHSGAIALHGTR
ncbi:MAG: HisA/HisF-related TIM barrel protein [Pseudomonadota bacterium]|nr:HisA/HisF-related TIM barrel protein [Pseudomonadota bacterium]